MAGNMVVQIRNYQRLKKANFVFEPGLNVIVGASNNGKSSTLRAITTALFNLSKDSHVTIGETVSVVGIRYNGHDVVWKRDLNSASKNSYKIDGRTYTKLGKGQPKEVADALGIFEIDLDDTKERLNFQKQMAYPFLLDRTPSQVFKFMAQSAEEDNLMSIIDQMKTDQNSISVTIKANEAAMDSIKVALLREKQAFDSIKGKAKVCKVIIDLDSVVKKFTDLEGRLSTIEGLSQTKIESESELAVVNDKLPKVLKAIEEVEPLFTSLQEFGQLVTAADGVFQVMKKSESEFQQAEQKLKVFSTMPSAEVFSEMAMIYAIYSQGSQALMDKRMHSENVSVLEDQINSVEQSLLRARTLLERADGLSNELDSLDKLIKLSGDYWHQCADYKKEIGVISDDLVKVEKELQEFDVCPYCGSDLRRGEHGEH